MTAGDHDVERLDDGTPRFNNDNYVLVRRADYDNLARAVHHEPVNDVYLAAKHLIDHVNDDRPQFDHDDDTTTVHGAR